MKTGYLIFALMLFSTFGFSQETETLFSNDGIEARSFGGFGGPFVQAANINSDLGILIGGKGGVVINRKFAFGGIGEGLAENVDFLGDNLDGSNEASLSLAYGAGGIFVEYISNRESAVHFTIPVNFMAGKVTVSDATSENEEIESSGIFILEPGVNLEFNISQNFVPGIYVSYRQVFGSSLDNLNDQDISGVNIGLMFKFGSF